MIRFYNGLVLTMDGECTPKSAEVWVDGGRIAFVGQPSSSELAGKVFEREIDLCSGLLMPGFKNAHTHSPMTFLRSQADDMPLQDWLTKQVFPMEAKLDEQRCYWFSKLAILEYLSSGCTAVFDMYFLNEGFARACAESGFRSVLCGAETGEADRLYELERELEKYGSMSPLISYVLGCHAEYSCSKELIAGLGALARKYKLPTATHNSETQKEIADCIDRYGMTPTQLFESVGAYDYGGTNFHCVHMTGEDLRIFKEHGVSCVHCPASNLKLASGIADIVKMQQMGINIALGTDGAASNNALDMFREMYLMTALQKVKTQNAAACDAKSVLRAATVGGARAMFLDDCDVIAVGKQADLVVISLDSPNMQPVNDIVNNLVYSAGKTNVRLTMCAGRVLYENGEYFIGEQPEHIYEQVSRLVKEMKES